LEKAEGHLLAREPTKLLEIFIVEPLVSGAQLAARSERTYLFGFVLPSQPASEIVALPVTEYPCLGKLE
jgi:hypothetical protein